MRTRTGLGLFAVVVVAAAVLSPLSAQDKGKSVKPKYLYGYDLKVRAGTAAEWDKAPRIGVEVYQHEATGANIGITDVGSIAAYPATAPAMKQGTTWKTGMGLTVRKAGEAEFTQKSQKIGIEMVQDMGSNQFLYISQSGSIAFAPVVSLSDKEPVWHHGLSMKVRNPEQATFENAKQYGIEVYKDMSTGGLVYVCETGAIATGRAPEQAPDKTKIAQPKPAFGLVLQVRKADEAEFTPQTKKIGVEAFEDPNSGLLVFLTEQGFLATAPKPSKPYGAGKPEWVAAMTMSARKAGEQDFSKATKYGVEVFKDRKTGYLIFISETGSIAVLPQ